MSEPTSEGERYLAVQFVVRAEGIDQDELLDKLQAMFCEQPITHQPEDCPLVSMASSGGTYEQVSGWCDGVYPEERRQLRQALEVAASMPDGPTPGGAMLNAREVARHALATTQSDEKESPR